MKRGMLKYWIMRITQESPRNGTEIITEMESRSHGNWRPSPGSVYPALSQMEMKGLLIKNKDNKYTISLEGVKELNRYDELMKALIGKDDENEILEETIGNISYIIETLKEGKFNRKLLDDLGKKATELLEVIKNVR
jgi:DNA-binding PadR family transcriptional regulator